MNTIILAADHAGFALKEEVKKHLSKTYQIVDVGASSLVPEDDYPTYMVAAAMKVAEDLEGNTKAIIFGKSGQGEAMVANRLPGVRACVWYGGDVEVLKLTRQHNDANILSIGAGFIDTKTAIEATQIWLNTEFSKEEKHVRRIAMIDNIE